MQTLRFNARGVVDALDGGTIPEGGLYAATNLIFDPSNPFTFQCRPAVDKRTDFSTFTGAGFVSVAYVVGSICYGMIKSSIVNGRDYPFAYDLSTDTFYTVSGTKNTNTLPVSQSTTGDWTPPTMALVGVLLYVTHPGFPGSAAAHFGWFDLTIPAAPVWHGANTTTNLIPGVPTAVCEFNNRAWFSYKNSLYFTDALTTTITNASQILIIGDSVNITALAQQSLITSVQGSIQSLVVFKLNTFALITGDAANGNLAINLSKSGVGCSAGRTIAPTSRGLKFMASDGIRLLGQDGTLGDPNQDLQLPFISALYPSRASASYNNNIYRISVQNGNANGSPIQEYWFDERRNGWSGPHSFIQDMATPYGGSFVAFSSTLAPGLYVSDVVQSGISIYTELGSIMQFAYGTSTLPDVGNMYENSAILSTIDLQMPNNGDAYTFSASDVERGVLSVASIASPPNGLIWGNATWGAGTWTPFSYGMDTYNIPWTEPLVFNRMLLQVSGPCSAKFKIGKIKIGYQPSKFIRIRTL